MPAGLSSPHIAKKKTTTEVHKANATATVVTPMMNRSETLGYYVVSCFMVFSLFQVSSVYCAVPFLLDV